MSARIAMQIRPATAADVPLVLPMVACVCAMHEKLDAAKYGFLPGVAEMYRSWLTARAKDARSVFLVAEREEGKLAGFLIATVEREIPIYRLEEFGFVHDLWVEEEYRHEGVGRQLVMEAVGRFTELGVKQVRLDVAVANSAARGLFEKCGFRTSVTEMLVEIEKWKFE